MPAMSNLPEITVGAAARKGGVTVVPVFATTVLPYTDYALVSDAVAAGKLEISELPRGPTVNALRARNRSRRRVLIIEGDHLIGARQNRMVTSSALIGGRRDVEIPVSCVEQGRWHGASSRFGSDASIGSPRLRSVAKATVTRSLFATGRRAVDQSQIWSQIAEQQRSLRVSSATAAFSHTYAARAVDITEIAAALPYTPGAIGIALGVGTELVSIDLFDRPETCRSYWRRLVEGAALESLAVRGPVHLSGSEVVRLLDELRAADWTAVPAIGEGEELRTRVPRATASLLRIDGGIVHFGVATGAAGGAVAGAAIDLGNAVMRHDLPESLAARFRIIGRIGVGGTKEVFRAVDAHGGPDVAIARIPAVDRAQFEAEVALARRVEGDYVPRIVEAQIDAYGDGYLVMERCDGPSLAQIVGSGAMSLPDAAPILVALARGLCAIHATAVLHRDIKLENVMLSSGASGPQIKILDFGLSAQARTATTAVFALRELGGTLPYMAREALHGASVDARTDVFSFGVCCFRILTGQFPTPPHDHEAELEYMNRLAQTRIDTERLPAALPAAVRDVIARALDSDRDRRPFMPEVVAVFEQAFGTSPLPAAPAVAAPARCVEFQPALRLPIAILQPEHLLVAACPYAPLVALAPDPSRGTTSVRAFGADGKARWARQLDGIITTGIRADLDRDGVREIYLAGTDRVVALEATGAVRFWQRTDRRAAPPSLLALPDARQPQLVLDGHTLDVRTGAQLGTLAAVYRGDGHRLVPAGGGAHDDLGGLAYNGVALQGFRGDHGTAAAILCHPGADRFLVAHLEETRSGRVHVAVYGPGGGRLHTLAVSTVPVDTGDLSTISRVYAGRPPLFGPQHAPIAALGDGGSAVVIVPLFDPGRGAAATLVGFELPSGRELWRSPRDALGGRALLADLRGDGQAQLVIGTGHELTVLDPWTGQARSSVESHGVPVAFGDPFCTGAAHLITASVDGVELWRGPRCRPGG
ncbi:MAG TPA: serine/threonine-protein kinase, partial [Kofleriaceae bacterium]|nr:serine/threonine-protein kinase [Kofleriaceae bacterium]